MCLWQLMSRSGLTEGQRDTLECFKALMESFVFRSSLLESNDKKTKVEEEVRCAESLSKSTR